MKKRKIITLCLVLALLAIAAVGGTLAYFTDTDAAQNTFTVGKVDIELEEPEYTSASAIKMQTLMPGTTIAKDPTITVASDSEDCWLVVEIDWTRYAPFVSAYMQNKGKTATNLATEAGLADLAAFYFVDYKADKWTLLNLTEIQTALASPENPEHLILHLGYNYPLEANNEANNKVVMFTGIKMDESITSEQAKLFWEYANGSPKDNSPIHMDITAYAIQRENIDNINAAYAALKGSSVSDKLN